MITSILDSRYRVEQEIGSGGIGRVYRAFDTRLNIPVAIKFTIPANADAAIAFYREAELLSILHHPSLPRVIDFNKINETQYIVMEYIEGDDLKTQLEKRNAPFDYDEVIDWVRQLLNVIGYLHDQGIQHRDIKPANIKIHNNHVYLLDFGIAYGQTGEMSTMNSQNFPWLSGTHEFCSFEQFTGAKTTPASDLYSLAATLYVLLTGKLLPGAGDRIQSLALEKIDPLVPLETTAPKLDKAISKTIMTALNLEAKQRPQTAEQMYLMMFRQKTEKPKRRLLHKMAVASGLLILVLISMIVGNNIGHSTPGKKVVSNNVQPEIKEIVPTPREESAALSEEALALQQSGKYKEALQKAEDALTKDPDYSFAHLVCGDIEWDSSYDNAESLSEMKSVQEHADKILRSTVAPQNAEEFIARAWANLAKEKYDVAIADSTKAIEMKPEKSKLVAALMIRASAKSFIPDENSKSILSAFDDYEKAIQLMPNYVQAWSNKAAAYYSLGKYEWAISDYTEAIRILPSARYYSGRGDSYYALGKYNEALAEYKEALKFNPKHLNSLTSVGEIYSKQEDWQKAIASYTKSLAVKPTFLAYRSRGAANGQMSDFDKAVKDFSEALKFDDSDYLTYYYRATAFAFQKDYQKALADFTEAINKVSDKDTETLAKLYSYRSQIYDEINEPEKARADEKKAKTLSK